MEEIDMEQKRKAIVGKIKGFFSESSGSDSNSDSDSGDDLNKKREDLIRTLKEKKNWIAYIILVAIIWFGSYVRTLNLGNLKDVTTGKFVPMALDPHLFLRYAKQIVETGTLVATDFGRFVPEGISTIKYKFMAYFIFGLYKVINFFGEYTIEYADVIYPVVCFAIALVFFFLLVRRLFDVKIALLATLFLAIVPTFLHRTMAGFSDHEALGTMLMFMGMYFYVLGWQTKDVKKTLLWGALAGVATGMMGLSWGGWKFLLLIIGLFVLIEFFFDKIDKKDIYQYGVWVVAFVLVTTVWIPQFSLLDLVESFTSAIVFLVLFVLLVDLALFKFDLFKIKKKFEGKVPLGVVSLVVSLVVGVLLVGSLLGPSAMTEQLGEISNSLLHPLGNDRWELTVAEQHQPYFTDWVNSFGPKMFGIPLYLTLFMIGSVLLFYLMVSKFKRRVWMTGVYIAFILAFIMSRHSSGSTFNGVNTISKVFYLGSLGLFALLSMWFYFKSYYQKKEDYQKILGLDKKYVFVLIWFLIMVVAARGAIRLMYIFTPITAVLAAVAVFKMGEYVMAVKQKWYKYLGVALLILILFNPFALINISIFKFMEEGIVPSFSKSISSQAKYSGPGYNQQWQIAGAWARENIPEDAVFGHWWDYGSWVQSGFERATVLDGTNKIKYWNYLMGRHVLTGESQTEALEFLKVHDTTHYLIVSDEIGKYTAYSSIGSDKDQDRYSWITTFLRDAKSTQETRDETVYVYPGSYVFDEDVVIDGQVYPRGGSGVGAVFLPVKMKEDSVEFAQPKVAVMSNGKRTDIPLKCLYYNGKMITFSEGLDGCFRIIPTLDGSGQLADSLGAGLYVSAKGMKALWVNMYVFEQKNENFDTSAFELVYGEDGTYAPLSVFQGRVVGPIKIWKINYPPGFTVSKELEEKYLGGNELLPDYFFDV